MMSNLKASLEEKIRLKEEKNSQIHERLDHLETQLSKKDTWIEDLRGKVSDVRQSLEDYMLYLVKCKFKEFELQI